MMPKSEKPRHACGQGTSPRLLSKDSVAVKLIIKGCIKSRDAVGYASRHSLIEEKIIPQALIELRTELALPQHRDIFDKASKGLNFSECLAIIAAELRIVLDGYYDVDKLAEMLVLQLRRRGSSLMIEGSGLIPVELKETENSIEVHPVLDVFTRMMHEAGCLQCDNKGACMKAGHCLGEDSRAERGYLTKQQKEEYGL